MAFFSNPLFFLIRALAFLPVTVIKTRNSNMIDFKISKGMIPFSCFHVVLILYSIYAQTIRNNEDVEPGNITYTQTVTFTALSNLYVMHAIPIPCVFQFRNKIEVFKEISDLSSFIQGGTYTGRKRLVPYFILAYVSYSLVSVVYFLRAEYVLKIMFFNDYLKFIFTCVVVEFFEVVSDVNDCFYQLNAILPETFERNYAKETILQNVPLVKNVSVSQMANLDLKSVFELHRRLCRVVERINDVYGCQNLLVVVFVFLQLIYCPLELLSLPAFYHTWPVLAHHVNGTLVYLVLLYVLVRPCSHTAAEAKRTVAILSKLMEKSVHGDLFRELEQYCRQLFLRKVEFSACGFFTLEIPLILSMLSVVTTYFTIIVQFQMSDIKKGISTTETTLSDSNLTLKP